MLCKSCHIRSISERENSSCVFLEYSEVVKFLGKLGRQVSLKVHYLGEFIGSEVNGL